MLHGSRHAHQIEAASFSCVHYRELHMSKIHNGETSYVTTIGSDVTRDGFFAELCRETNDIPVGVAEAFWSDVASTFEVTVSESPIPFSVLEAFLAEARLRVSPSSTQQEKNLFVSSVQASGT